MLKITLHACQRIRKRIGIPKRSVKRQVWMALTRGRTVTGNIFKKHPFLALSKGYTYVTHGSFLYVMYHKNKDIMLVTVLPKNEIAKPTKDTP